MRSCLILLLSAFFNIVSISAQGIPAERLTIENGLSQGMIFDIYQTRDGFLWVATKDGLNRYDGNNFKVFSNDPFDPFSLAENTIATMYEDSRGWLWLGTDSKGLDLYDYKTGRFHHFSLNIDKDYLVERVAVLKIRESADGAIWLMKGGVGLLHINIPSAWAAGLPEESNLDQLAKVERFQIGSHQSEGDRVVDFERRPNGDLLVTSHIAQYSVDPLRGTYHALNEGLLPTYIMKAAVTLEGDKEVCWFMDDHHISRLYNGVLRQFDLPDYMINSRKVFLKDNTGHIRIVMTNGVWETAADKEIAVSKPDFKIPEQANCFHRDRNGNLWIGTLGYGLYKIYSAKKSFYAGAAGNSIAGVWKDPQGRYYCKTFSTIISTYDPLSGRLESKSAFPDAGKNQEFMAFDRSGNTWLLCSDDVITGKGTIRIYNPERYFIREHPLEEKLSHREQLFFSRDGNLWIALGSCRLMRLNPASGQRDSFNFAALFGDKTTSVRINSMAEDANGLLWLGTQLGLVKCTPANGSYNFQLILADPKNPKGLNNNSIACLLIDPVQSGSTLWIGTKGGGINRFDIVTNDCQHITTADGLPNNVIYGILPDSKNNLWCSSNRGLAKISVSQRTPPLVFDITAFTVKMGLQDNEFNTFSYFKANNGEMLFGGVNGLNHFFPESLQQDTMAAPVFIVGLEINHQAATQQLYGPVERLQKLELNYDQNDLSFEFAALDFTDPGKNRYRYRLVGIDEKWVETGNNRFAHFSHLAPGRYEFRVEGSNGESDWQAAPFPVIILIHPPWWRSDAALLFYFLLLGYLGWTAYQAQIRRVKIREALAFEIREAERIRTVEQMKTNFFSNITHEFRTPLTLIIEPLRQLLKTPAGESWRPQVQMAESNSRKMLGLVNQLLDMAKLESGSMTIDLRQGDLKLYIRTLIETFLPLAAQRGIKLNFQPDGEIPSFLFDQGKVELILNNLLSNAFKFTPEGGAVTVRLTADDRINAKENQPPSIVHRPSSTVPRLPSAVITVADSGAGIPAEDLEKIFDRFYQVDASHTRSGEGTGIGLSLSRDLAQLMGGSIHVESYPGNGAVFSVWLPMEGIGAEGAIQPATAFPAVMPDQPPPTAGEGSQRVALVIEDNTELRAFIRQSIAGEWQVVDAPSGKEGVRKALELLPDLVISDLMMPEMDGYEVCHALKTQELTAHIPVILLTAKSGMDSRIKGLRIGADDYLTKPFNTEELLARMENLVGLRRKLLAQFGKRLLVSDQEAGSESPEFLSPPDREFLRKLRLTLERHLQEEQFGVEEISRAMSISRMQLHRKLKAISDQSATEFIRTYRLERAMALLKNREGNVIQVSRMVGFGNEKYFSATFKAHFGVSPSEV